MKNKDSSLRLLLLMLPIILRILLGAVACFLILFGIHWIAILTGIALGIIYYIIPRK